VVRLSRRIIEKIPENMASIYEKATRMVIESYYGRVAEEIVSNLKYDTILDLGTGPGYLPIEMAKRSPFVKVDGIDLTRELINMAQENAVKAGVADRVHFEVGDAANLRFEDGSYGMVISTGMLHMLKDPVKVLRECYRVLRSGGEAWIYDPARVSSQIDKKRWKASFTFRERLFYRLFTLGVLFNPLRTYKREEVIEMISATNFKEYWIEEGDGELKIRLRR